MFETPPLSDVWFVACLARGLRRGPKALTIQGKPLVLFRGADGLPVALTDRCPHRNVPLSMGQVRGGELECAYHGWRFDSQGACVAVPGLVEGEISLKSRCAEPWACLEQDGLVWVYSTPSVTPSTAPPSFPHAAEAGYSTVRREFTVEAPIHAVIENILDVPHTAFLHGGLFRTAQKKHEIEVVVRRHETWAEAQFLGEPRPTGLLGRLLAPQGGLVEHTDRFLLPSLAQVEYRLGPKSHLISTSAVTPVSATVSRVFAVVTFKLPLPHWLVKPFVSPIAERIFAQDAVILRRQTAHIQAFGGERYTSTELDVLGPQIARLLKQASDREPGSSHEHRIKMKT